jgi:glycosyltransferase involved in cell wall biosynthesis
MASPRTPPLVSVAISFFNNEDVLAQAIASILNQSFSGWELILIDGGSSDRSLEIARGFVDRRIRVVADGRYKSFVESLNESVALAAGRLYARMDSDDAMHPRRLERQVSFLESHPEVHAVDTAMYSMTQEGRLTGVRARPAPKDWTLASVLSGNALNHATVMGRVEWFRANPYDPSYLRAEDLELWCRTVERSVFARIQEPLYFVREGKVNVRNYRLSQRTSRRILRRYGPRCFPRGKLERLIARTYLKSAAYAVLGAAGMQDLLSQARNRGVAPDIEAEAQRALEAAIRR